MHYKRDVPAPDPARQALLRAAREAVAAIPAPDAPVLLEVPLPFPCGKTQVVCPVPGCNQRFKSMERYALHYRVRHQQEEQE